MGSPKIRRVGKEAHEIVCGNEIILVHYNSLLVYKIGSTVYLGKDWNFSRTSMKLVSNMLNTTSAEIRNKLSNNFYTLLE